MFCRSCVRPCESQVFLLDPTEEEVIAGFVPDSGDNLDSTSPALSG